MQDESTKTAENRLVLPPWRCMEIIQKASEAIGMVRLSECHCDALTFAQKLGITVRPYSSFTPEHLAQMQNINISFWKDGLCYFAPGGRLDEAYIFYDDTADKGQIQVIITHELGHIILGHTQQSLNAETEAFFFSGILIGLLLIIGIAELEQQVDSIVRETKNIQKFLHGFRTQKEAKAV